MRTSGGFLPCFSGAGFSEKTRYSEKQRERLHSRCFSRAVAGAGAGRRETGRISRGSCDRPFSCKETSALPICPAVLSGYPRWRRGVRAWEKPSADQPSSELCYSSICLPRNAAATCVNLTSPSLATAPLSGRSRQTAPMTSPAETMGIITDA